MRYRIGFWQWIVVLGCVAVSLLVPPATEAREAGVSVARLGALEGPAVILAQAGEALVQGGTVAAAAPDPRPMSAAGGAAVDGGTSGSTAAHALPDWLAFIANPNVAYLLLLLGIFGVVYEMANPGTVVPGAVGVLSLSLAIYAFQTLPVNLGGLALLALGVGLLIAEAMTPTLGVLGLIGLAAFVFGSVILVSTDAPGVRLSLPLVLTSALISALLLFFTVGLAVKVRRRPVVTGSEELLGTVGESIKGFPGQGSVRLRGEVWSAYSDQAIPPGAPVQVIGRDGLVLLVEPMSHVSREDSPC